MSLESRGAVTRPDSAIGRSCLVTAGGAGIGRAIALEWAAEGGSVVVGDLDREAAIETAWHPGRSRPSLLQRPRLPRPLPAFPIWRIRPMVPLPTVLPAPALFQ